MNKNNRSKTSEVPACRLWPHGAALLPARLPFSAIWSSWSRSPWLSVHIWRHALAMQCTVLPFGTHACTLSQQRMRRGIRASRHMMVMGVNVYLKICHLFLLIQYTFPRVGWTILEKTKLSAFVFRFVTTTTKKSSDSSLWSGPIVSRVGQARRLAAKRSHAQQCKQIASSRTWRRDDVSSGGS